MLKRLKHPSKRLLSTIGLFFLPSKKRITQKVNPLFVLDRKIKQSFRSHTLHPPKPKTWTSTSIFQTNPCHFFKKNKKHPFCVFPLPNRHKLPNFHPTTRIIQSESSIVQAEQQNNRSCHLPRDHCPAYWPHLHHDRSTHQWPARHCFPGNLEEFCYELYRQVVE